MKCAFCEEEAIGKFIMQDGIILLLCNKHSRNHKPANLFKRLLAKLMKS